MSGELKTQSALPGSRKIKPFCRGPVLHPLASGRKEPGRLLKPGYPAHCATAGPAPNGTLQVEYPLQTLCSQLEKTLASDPTNPCRSGCFQRAAIWTVSRLTQISKTLWSAPNIPPSVRRFSTPGYGPTMTGTCEKAIIQNLSPRTANGNTTPTSCLKRGRY